MSAMDFYSSSLYCLVDQVDYLMWVGPRMLLSAPRDEIRRKQHCKQFLSIIVVQSCCWTLLKPLLASVWRRRAQTPRTCPVRCFHLFYFISLSPRSPVYSAPLSLVTHAGDQDLPSSAKNVPKL